MTSFPDIWWGPGLYARLPADIWLNRAQVHVAKRIVRVYAKRNFASHGCFRPDIAVESCTATVAEPIVLDELKRRDFVERWPLLERQSKLMFCKTHAESFIAVGGKVLSFCSLVILSPFLRCVHHMSFVFSQPDTPRKRREPFSYW